ncbi:hypothetical protein GCM10010912_59030 [Paenibacillus albidus]|uniref:Uncharacterized protein n=1 Tax=Paenibacillus albidus TaxID=2041023 RepID=A0A917D1T9_9BACL|nr:hypothetical protein GCM10010912_59030 [Paenibacillus albidus]
MFGGDLPVMHQSRKWRTENGRATFHTTLPWVHYKMYDFMGMCI